MIVINKSSINIIALTLTEKVSLSNPYFLFEFSNAEGSKFFISSDTSQYKDRYNKFSITEKASPNALAGEVLLSVGFYEYKVREQASGTNLDPAQSGAVVESGKVQVIQDASAIPTYDNIKETYATYAG